MVNIKLCYTKINSKLSSERFTNYLRTLPFDQQERNKRFHRWQDRHCHLFGRLLLNHTLRSLGVKNTLQDVQYDSFSRPFIPGNIDFNISHAGSFVVCATGLGLRLGVDVEHYHQVELMDYKDCMKNDEWHDILSSSNPSNTFLKYWTMKESVVKADGRGLSIPLSSIELNNNVAQIDNKIWHFREVLINSACLLFIAYDIPNVAISIEECFF